MSCNPVVPPESATHLAKRPGERLQLQISAFAGPNSVPSQGSAKALNLDVEPGSTSATASGKPTQHQVATLWPPRLAWLVHREPSAYLPPEPAAGLAPFKTAIIQTYTLTSPCSPQKTACEPSQTDTILRRDPNLLTYTLTCARRTEDATRTRLRRRTPSRAFILVFPSHPLACAALRAALSPEPARPHPSPRPLP